MREKLIEWIRRAKEMREADAMDIVRESECDIFDKLAELRSETEYISDHLIANGVVVQKWIPVSEQEEPTENGTYWCHGYWLGSGRKQTETADFIGEWDIANNFILTHWMTLPAPPKGE